MPISERSLDWRGVIDELRLPLAVRPHLQSASQGTK